MSVAETGAQSPILRPEEGFALDLDAHDGLGGFRERFLLPAGPGGQAVRYFAGNSLGLQPRAARECVESVLRDWAELGVAGHFEGAMPWYPYHEMFRESGARLVGAKPGEVVIMNSLTVNLHLMLVSFYRPTKTRYKILMEAPAFPSDTYAIRTQLRYHGHDPDEALVVARPRAGQHTLAVEDLEELLARDAETVAVVMLSGVNFVTGQLMDMARIAKAAGKQGCVVGFDLAHAAGNVPLHLHDWDVDFAVWCNYKYLNSGPGAVGGCFVHERHGEDLDLPRFAGWWGNDPRTRFRMQLESEFVPRYGADGWQVSNPPILSMAPVKASYDIFDEVGMEALRSKSVRLTGYLEFLLKGLESSSFEIITPSDPGQRGCQLSLMFGQEANTVLQKLRDRGVVCDFREPNIIRVAPVPLYNTFHDVWWMATSLGEALRGS